MRSVRRRPLGENLPTSLSIPLEISPYRNLLESSTPVALTAELDPIIRAPEFLSGQPPSGHPLLTNSGPLITPLQRDVALCEHPPSRR